jgi:thioredoxin 1
MTEFRFKTARHPSETLSCRRNPLDYFMRLLTGGEFESFVAAKPAAAIHFDAAWDKTYRPIVRRKMENAKENLDEQVNFGEVDCDCDPELAKSIPVLNVPSVAYYRNGTLIRVLVGAEQNVQIHLERILRDA